MKKYEIKTPITLACGKVGLTDDQHRTRSHNLRQVDKGVYEIISPVQFKAGETITYNGELSKSQAADVLELEEATKRESIKALIEKINSCATIAEVEDLTIGETRPKVIAAATERKAVLEAELAKEAEALTLDDVVKKIEACDLVSEIDAFMSELDSEGLTEEEKTIITLAVEKQTEMIQKGAGK